MLALLSRATRGSLSILGVDALEEPDELRRRIGLISHRPMLYGDLTARENLEFFASLYGGVDSARIDELLSLVELDHRRSDPVRTYSRGMQQRLSIARALVNDPDLVLLDEPYSGLDPHAAELFDALIARVRDGRTFVMVSHDLDRGYAMCTHALIMARCRSLCAPSAPPWTSTLFVIYIWRLWRWGWHSMSDGKGGSRPAGASALAQYRALLMKDIRQELRTREMLTSMVVYALLVLTVYGAALAQVGDRVDVAVFAVGLLWALVVFTSLLGLSTAASAMRPSRGAWRASCWHRSTAPWCFLPRRRPTSSSCWWSRPWSSRCSSCSSSRGSSSPPPRPDIVLPLLVGTVGVAGVGTLLSTIAIDTRLPRRAPRDPVHPGGVPAALRMCAPRRPRHSSGSRGPSASSGARWAWRRPTHVSSYGGGVLVGTSSWWKRLGAARGVPARG